MRAGPFRIGALVMAAAASLASLAAGCASAPVGPAGRSERYPALPRPDVPVDLGVDGPTRVRMEAAWDALQSGDLGGAAGGYRAILGRDAAFYPAETGLALVAIAKGDHDEAVARLLAVTGSHQSYVPAWRALIDARIGRDEFDEASAALNRLVAMDPAREGERLRIELARVRRVQALVETGRSLRTSERWADAEAALVRALALAPSSAAILRELAEVDVARGRLADAETRLQQAGAADPGDAATFGALGTLFESGGRWREAADAYARAAAIDPAWRGRAEAARNLAHARDMPLELRDVPTAAAVTRGQLAALIGVRLGPLLDRAPARVPAVATDVQGHWAAAWIFRVTQAGVMEVYSNHTFRPASQVRRIDLAQTVAGLLPIAASARPADLGRWLDASPLLADVPVSSLFYRPAALAVAAGLMSIDEAGRFWPTRPAAGADVVAAIARLERLPDR